MTWREPSNQDGFSIVGLHKIHHDDIPQVLTEKLAQELRECAHNMHKDRFLRLDYIVICHIIKSINNALFPANVCDGSCKRLKPRSQTFATEDANVCVFQAQTVE